MPNRPVSLVLFIVFGRTREGCLAGFAFQRAFLLRSAPFVACSGTKRSSLGGREKLTATYILTFLSNVWLIPMVQKRLQLWNRQPCDFWRCPRWNIRLKAERSTYASPSFAPWCWVSWARVAIIYAIVIIYVPAKTVLESNLEGGVMCTTLSKEGNLTGEGTCDKWHSCVEWCLSKSTKECDHVWAAVRDMGTQIWWEACDLSNMTFVDHKCNTMEDLKELNCKLYPTEEGEAKRRPHKKLLQ